jgi:hypothetical protein
MSPPPSARNHGVLDLSLSLGEKRVTSLSSTVQFLREHSVILTMTRSPLYSRDLKEVFQGKD